MSRNLEKEKETDAGGLHGCQVSCWVGEPAIGTRGWSWTAATGISCSFSSSLSRKVQKTTANKWNPLLDLHSACVCQLYFMNFSHTAMENRQVKWIKVPFLQLTGDPWSGSTCLDKDSKVITSLQVTEPLGVLLDPTMRGVIGTKGEVGWSLFRKWN